jgi:3-oxoacyl-[acyl-carrier protein] reductase
MYQIDLKGKVALVTGGSRGIGRAISALLANAGATVVVNYKKSDKEAKELVSMIHKAGGKAQAMKADLSHEDDVKQLFKDIQTSYGQLDILINNAGYLKNGLILMTSAKDFDGMMAINCRGTFLCMRSAIKLMMGKKSGKIINIASIVGKEGSRGQAAYAATKAAIIGLTRSAAKELGTLGITVNAIAPGFIETDMMKDASKDVRADVLSKIALGRLGTPEDVARVALFLSSPLADYVNGQILGVDGCQIM